MASTVRGGKAKGRPAKRVTPAPKPPKPLTRGDVEKKLRKVDRGFARKRRDDHRFAQEIASGAPAKLLAALKDVDPRVRADALQALGEIGHQEATPAIRALLEDDPVAQVRSAAALCLVRLGDPALLGEMVKGLSDPDAKEAVGAALGLGLAKSRAAVPHLVKALEKGEPALGAAAASALGMIGDLSAIPALDAAIARNFVPAAACDALGKLGDAEGTPAVVRAMTHHDGEVRASAARALGQIPKGAKKVLPELRRLLEDPSPRVRMSAALALFELGDKAAAKQVVAILK